MTPRLPAKIIDFHAHLFPDDVFEAIWSYFKRVYGFEVVHRLHARECMEYLRERGVDTVVYSNYAHKKGITAVLNEWNVRFLDSTPGTCCFTAFHPDDDDALERARDVLAHPGILGFKLHFLVQQIYPEDERLFPLYELVIEKGKRLLMHVGTGPVGNEYVGIRHLRRVLERYPHLPVNVAHMGGFEFEEFFSLRHDHPRIFFDTAYCFLPGDFRMFRLGNDFLERHKDRILYGSDFPNLFHDRQCEVTALLSMGLSDEFYERVFRTNAERLLDGTLHMNTRASISLQDHQNK